MDEARAVSDMSIGESGTIRRLEGPVGIRQRLQEMGLTRGTLVRLIRTAPLGDPIEIQVRGYRLGVRKADAAALIIGAE